MSELPEFGLKDEYRTHHFRQDRIRAKKGPSNWHAVKDDPDAYGKHYDFRILDGDVFVPACRAAQAYVYEKFPADCTYYTLAPDNGECWVGVVVDKGLDKILEQAAIDGLISEEFALNALNEQTRGAR